MTYRIKPLEWRADGHGFTARTLIGVYGVIQFEGGASWILHAYMHSLSSPLATLEEAKAAAEADWQARIKEALEPVSSGWQPMDTAPIGKSILMLMKHGAIEGMWDGAVGFGYYWRDMEWFPTHWQPIPEPPREEQE